MLQHARAIIPESDDTSNAVDVAAGRVVSIIMPADFDGAALTFLASPNVPDTALGGASNDALPVMLDDGNELSITVAQATYVCLGADAQLAFAGIRELTVISDATESAERVLLFLLDVSDG